MKVHARQVLRFATLILLSMSVAQAASQSNPSQAAANSVGIWQSRQMLMESAEYAYIIVVTPNNRYSMIRVGRSGVRFTPSGFAFHVSYGGSSNTAAMDFDTLEGPPKAIWQNVLLVQGNGGKPLKTIDEVFNEWKHRKHSSIKKNEQAPSEFSGLYVSEAYNQLLTSKSLGWWDRWDPNTAWENLPCTSECIQAQQKFVLAINRLREFALDPAHRIVVSDFSQRAAAWRALPTKPEISEEVRVQRLLAESALKEKQLVKAMIHYETGLKLYPTWPQGYFNSALIAAELGQYAEAVEYMNAYLELVPNASDAQSARDQTAMWRYKAGQSMHAAEAAGQLNRK